MVMITRYFKSVKLDVQADLHLCTNLCFLRRGTHPVTYTKADILQSDRNVRKMTRANYR